jgi:hypothetical protein
MEEVVVVHPHYCAWDDGEDSGSRVAWDAATPNDHDDDEDAVAAVVRNHWVDLEDTSWEPWVDEDDEDCVVVRNSIHHWDEAWVAAAREDDVDGDDYAWNTASADTLATLTTLACASC